jgi:hypothetical protein
MSMTCFSLSVQLDMLAAVISYWSTPNEKPVCDRCNHGRAMSEHLHFIPRAREVPQVQTPPTYWTYNNYKIVLIAKPDHNWFLVEFFRVAAWWWCCFRNDPGGYFSETNVALLSIVVRRSWCKSLSPFRLITLSSLVFSLLACYWLILTLACIRCRRSFISAVFKYLWLDGLLLSSLL